MKIVIGNYPDPEDNRNLILNSEVKDYSTGSQISPLMALISSVSGLETPPYRNGTGDWSGADGGYLGTQLYGAREIVISGAYIDKMANCDYSSTSKDQFSHVARMYIRSRLPIRVKQIIRIFLDNGMTFFTEGYCTDLKMEYTYVGYGDYQITMFCPDPALYRGAKNGGLNSEWNVATLFKAQDVGYKSSWKEGGEKKYAMMYQDTEGVQSFVPNHHYTTSDAIVYGAISGERHLYVPKTDFTSGEAFDESDWNEQTELGTNHGYVWTTGGRSTAIQYTGDFPYYPQLIVELKTGEHCVNPSFYSVNEDKTFSLGYPETKVATFRVVDIDNDDKEHGRGAITEIEIVEGGSYDADYSGRKIQMQNYSSEREHGNTGYGCFLNLVAEKQS